MQHWPLKGTYKAVIMVLVDTTLLETSLITLAQRQNLLWEQHVAQMLYINKFNLYSNEL